MKERVVVVTGGSKGIGVEISKAFYGIGDKVIVAGREDVGFAHKLGVRAKFIPVDVTKVDSIEQFFIDAVRWAGAPIDILVNNAGKSSWRSIDNVDEQFWNYMIDVNLKSVMFMSKFAVGYLGKNASIINISSLAGKRGSANNSVYCAAKFGVNGITQSLAKELGKRGVRVNAICPVYIYTPGLVSALDEIESPMQSGLGVHEFFNEFAQSQCALDTLPTAVQIANTCLFLGSLEAGAITGQCLNVDCGVMPQ